MRVIDEVRKRIASVSVGLSDKAISKQISGGKYSKQRGQPVSTKAWRLEGVQQVQRREEIPRV